MPNIGGFSAAGGAGFSPPFRSPLTQLSPTILRSVLATSASNPTTAATVAGMNDTAIRQLAGTVQLVAPTVATLMTNPSDGAAQAALGAYSPVAIDIATKMVATGEGAKWGVADTLNPVGTLRRRAQPTRLVQGNVTVSAAGAGALNFAPQEPFEGYKLVMPNNGINSGFLSSILAGDRLMLTQQGQIPVELLREDSDCGRIDFPRVQLGEIISAQVTGATASSEVSGVLLGFGDRARILPEGAEILYTHWQPIGPVTIPAASVATVTIQPQRNIIIRRMGLDQTQPQFGSLYLQQWTTQDIPELVGPAGEFPLQLLNTLGWDEYLDMNMCQLGGLTTWTIRNAHATIAVIVQGLAQVDVVRLPHEVRR